MKKVYTGPEAEVVEFDTKDVITTSPSVLDSFAGESANEEQGWTGLFQKARDVHKWKQTPRECMYSRGCLFSFI